MEELQRSYRHIPFAYKEKVVALAEIHPKWSITTFQKQGFRRLKNAKMLRTWKNDIKQGGTAVDKWIQIEMQTFEKFKEARECLEQVKLYKIYFIL